MTPPAFRAQRLLADAGAIADVEGWLAEHAFGPWKAEYLGVGRQSGATPSTPRMSMRYTFDREDDYRAFLRQYPDAQAASAGPDQNDGGAAEPAAAPDSGFQQRAGEILSQPPPTAAGKVHLLGLDRVKTHFGDQWNKLAPRVENLVQRAIERRLAPRDVYHRTSGLSYLILFGELSDREAELKCAMMAEEISRLLLGDEMGGGLFDVQSIATGVDGPALLKELRDPEQIVGKIDGMVEQERERRATASTKSFEAKAKDPIEVEFVCRPIWDVRRSVVTNFVYVPLVRGGVRNAAPEGGEALQRFDHVLVQRAIADFMAMHRKGRRLPICLPIHFESVSTPTRRRALLERWVHIPTDYMRLAIFEICSLPDGIPQGRLAEMASALKLHSGGIFARVPVTTRAFHNFADTGIVAVGADALASPISEERMIEHFRVFAEGAERARVLAYVRGLRSVSLTVAAISSGFAYIDGEAVAAATERPDVAFRLNIEDIYSRVLQK